MEWLKGIVGMFVWKSGRALGKDVHITVPEIIVYVLYAIAALMALLYLYIKLKPLAHFLWLLFVRHLSPRDAWRVAMVTKALTGDK